MKEIVIISAARTPIGNFNGGLASLGPVDLGVAATKEAIKRAGIDASEIDETILGNILSAGHGQNIARQVSIGAGIPNTKPAMTINQLCGSGLRAVITATQLIAMGDADTVLAGGTESMSQAPYVLPKARFGQKMGHGKMIDSMIQDGLWDAFNDYHMGVTAENIAERWHISREEQDAFAAESQQKAEAAQKSGAFADEIVPVSIPQKKGDPVVIKDDEFPRHGTSAEKLAKLRPAFKKDGTVTAGNASGINDGAAAVIVMSAEKAAKLGLKPLAKIISYGNAALDPAIMGYGPVPATKQALERAGMNVNDLDVAELNEAFAAQSLAVVNDLGFDKKIVNLNGGAIALGHPIGASGARILTTLLYLMKNKELDKGLATLCIGGGQGSAMIVERIK